MEEYYLAALHPRIFANGMADGSIRVYIIGTIRRPIVAFKIEESNFTPIPEAIHWRPNRPDIDDYYIHQMRSALPFAEWWEIVGAAPMLNNLEHDILAGC
jgi:hypothetical protein